MLTNESVACAPHDAGLESPAGVRMSLAAAMTLGFAPGSFYRGARLFCINLLLTYKSGCAGRCAYCGLSRTRGAEASEGGKSFARANRQGEDSLSLLPSAEGGNAEVARGGGIR